MKTSLRCRNCGKVSPGEVVEDDFQGICPNCLLTFVLDESTEVSTPVLKPGATFRGMEVQELLGRGGMGVVYKARQVDLDRTVALKTLSPSVAGDPEFAERFAREAKAMASLSHPNIVPVYEFGTEGDIYFLTMEYVEGTSLRSLLKPGGLPESKALEIIPQICDAMEYAHTKGVIHRDIKPENILVGVDGTVKIADFGLAKMVTNPDGFLTRTDEVMGTPRYMAPEQWESTKDADHRADIYSLGVVFYEMLTGNLPVGNFRPASVHNDVINKSLEHRPEHRFGNVSEFRAALESPVTLGAPGQAAAVTRLVAWSVLSVLLLLAILMITGRRRELSFYFLGFAVWPTALLVGFRLKRGRRPFAVLTPASWGIFGGAILLLGGLGLLIGENIPAQRILSREALEKLIFACGLGAFALALWVGYRKQPRAAQVMATAGAICMIGGLVLYSKRDSEEPWNRSNWDPIEVHAFLVTFDEESNNPWSAILRLDGSTLHAAFNKTHGSVSDDDRNRIVQDVMKRFDPHFVTRDKPGRVVHNGKGTDLAPRTLVFFMPDYGDRDRAGDAIPILRSQFGHRLVDLATAWWKEDGLTVKDVQVMRGVARESFRFE